MLDGGDRIETRSTPTINEVVAELGEIGDRVNSFLGSVEDSLGSITGTGTERGESLFAGVQGMIEENRERLNTITSNLQSVSEKLAKGEGTLGKLINDDQVE